MWFKSRLGTLSHVGCRNITSRCHVTSSHFEAHTYSTGKPCKVHGVPVRPTIILITDGHPTETTLVGGPDQLDITKKEQVMTSERNRYTSKGDN